MGTTSGYPSHASLLRPSLEQKRSICTLINPHYPVVQSFMYTATHYLVYVFLLSEDLYKGFFSPNSFFRLRTVPRPSVS